MHFNEYDITCIHKAKELIDADISRHLTIANLAQKSGIGETKLKKMFKQYYGYSLFKYLRIERMVKAARLLVETGKTIKQVAGATGFKHPNNFTTAFTSYHKISPSRYRNLHSLECNN